MLSDSYDVICISHMTYHTFQVGHAPFLWRSVGSSELSVCVCVSGHDGVSVLWRNNRTDHLTRRRHQGTNRHPRLPVSTGSSETVTSLNPEPESPDFFFCGFLLQLLPAASFFQLRVLQRSCEATLSENLTPATVTDVYQSAKVRQHAAMTHTNDLPEIKPLI